MSDCVVDVLREEESDWLPIVVCLDNCGIQATSMVANAVAIERPLRMVPSLVHVIRQQYVQQKMLFAET